MKDTKSPFDQINKALRGATMPPREHILPRRNDNSSKLLANGAAEEFHLGYCRIDDVRCNRWSTFKIFAQVLFKTITASKLYDTTE